MTSYADGSDARELSAALERPIFNATLGKEVGAGVLDYEVYLKTTALYSLQSSRTELRAPDEHLFQVVHQSQELWLKAVAFEVVALVDALADARLHEASAMLDRIVAMQECLSNEVRVLQTLTPDAFLQIRRNLGNVSGLESPGYNRVLVAARAADDAFDTLLERSTMRLVDLYRGGSRHESREGLKRLAELLVDWDDAFQSWLVAHLQLVRRTTGANPEVLTLDGFPPYGLAPYGLAPRMARPLLPKLWQARLDLIEGGPVGARVTARAAYWLDADAPNAGRSAPPPSATRITERVPPARGTDGSPTHEPVPEP